MKAKIEYIANYLGINVSNQYALADIGEIRDIDKFIVFMKSNIKNTRLDFLNPLQKLTELKKMFEIEEHNDRLDKALSEAYKLADKVRDVKPLIKKEIESGKLPKLDELKLNGENYFSNFEIKTLSKIGDFRKICFLDDNFKLEDELSNVFSSVVLSIANTSVPMAQICTKDTKDVQSVGSVVEIGLKRF